MDVNILTFVLLSTPILGAVIPIQKWQPGTRYRADSIRAQVKLELFIDLLCPDSGAVWPEAKRIAETYGEDQVDLVVHQYPLPYHQHAHLAAQGFYLVQDLMNDTWAFNYMEWVLERSDLFRSPSTETRTTVEIKSFLAEYVRGIPGNRLSSAQFVRYVDFYRNPAVYAWKYGAQRGVSGTPWYFVNGVDLGISHALMYEEFSNLLDRLLN
ncbi:hypothetical protein LSH36_581g00004 [Paralvinella palmiformis]|uniref:Thioredoxin-like fold domain-containing protein n=1 Tax=Paralvinella palmiformis TaxID=53620 RepID=A0AAD9J5K1_9ANNE|nr:hypothetical protein LSH36_581g00004 [Paralvinella palmiformis]